MRACDYRAVLDLRSGLFVFSFKLRNAYLRYVRGRRNEPFNILRYLALFVLKVRYKFKCVISKRVMDFLLCIVQSPRTFVRNGYL